MLNFFKKILGTSSFNVIKSQEKKRGVQWNVERMI